jgi:hypothetical protein
MKKALVTVSLLSSLPFIAIAGGGHKVPGSKDNPRQTKATPIPLPTDGLTKEQSEAFDSVPNTDLPEEVRIKMEAEMEKKLTEEAAREKQKEGLKKKK